MLQGNVCNFVSEDTGQFLFILYQLEQSGGDEDVPSRDSESVRVRILTDRKIVRRVGPGSGTGDGIAYHGHVFQQLLVFRKPPEFG